MLRVQGFRNVRLAPHFGHLNFEIHDVIYVVPAVTRMHIPEEQLRDIVHETALLLSKEVEHLRDCPVCLDRVRAFVRAGIEEPAMPGREPLSLPMHRFERGAKVRVRDVIFSKHVGQRGHVIEIKPRRRGPRTLDKYVVQFSDGEKKEFWDIQLERAD